MRNRARHLDTQQPRNTQQEPKDTRNETTPHKDTPMPARVPDERQHAERLTHKDNEGEQHHR